MKSVLHFLLLSIVSCEMGHNFVKGPFVNVLIAGYIGGGNNRARNKESDLLCNTIHICTLTSGG